MDEQHSKRTRDSIDVALMVTAVTLIAIGMWLAFVGAPLP
jgi:hypothetical protein